MIRKYILCGLVIISCGVFLGPQGRARAVFLEVSPARVEALVRDGSYLPPIRVRNRGGEEVFVRASVVWGGHDIDGMPVTLKPPDPSGLPVKLWLEPEAFRLLPGESREIASRVEILDCQRGGAYPIILIECMPKTSKPPGPISRIAVITLLSFPWSPEGEGKLEAFDIYPPSGRGSLAFSCVFRSTGETHVTPEGWIRIRDASGEVVQAFPVRTGAVLPGRSRRFTAELATGTLPSGAYTAEASFTVKDAPAGRFRLAFRIGDLGTIAKLEALSPDL